MLTWIKALICNVEHILLGSLNRQPLDCSPFLLSKRCSGKIWDNLKIIVIQSLNGNNRVNTVLNEMKSIISSMKNDSCCEHFENIYRVDIKNGLQTEREYLASSNHLRMNIQLTPRRSYHPYCFYK